MSVDRDTEVDPFQGALEKHYAEHGSLPQYLAPPAADGHILIAFDNDEAGRQGALDFIEKHWNDLFDDPELDRRHNPTWVRDHEAYIDFLNDLYGTVFTYHRRVGERVDPKQCRRWPLPRLAWALGVWQQVKYKLLVFGNQPLLEWALPLVQQYEQVIVDELSRRATPKKLLPSANIPDRLEADDVLSRADLARVYEHYLKITPRGDELWGVCPKCQGHRENWSANAETGLYRCKKCGRKGSVFQFVMEIEGCSFPAALKKVADLGGAT